MIGEVADGFFLVCPECVLLQASTMPASGVRSVGVLWRCVCEQTSCVRGGQSIV